MRFSAATCLSCSTALSGLVFCCAISLLVFTAPASRGDTAADTSFEIIFRNGLVVDGSGDEPYQGTVAVRDGRLRVLAGAVSHWTADKEVDARGKVIAPGLIDLHTHARGDLLDPKRSAMTHYLKQGVTTVVIGNDGGGTPQIAKRFARIAAHGAGTHTAQYVGHAVLRRTVMSRTDRAATTDEIEAMKTLLEAGMREGAFGLSSGLFYADGSFATTEEMIALCRVVARYGGVYDSHIRAESSRGVGVLAAVDEAIRIGQESGVSVHIAHIKVLGRGSWGLAPEVVKRIEAARAAGTRVTADQYPWVASSTRLKSAVVSKRWQAGGDAKFREQLVDPATRDALLEDIRANIDRRGGADSLLLVEVAKPKWQGMRLHEIAHALELPPEEAAAQLLLAGSPGVVSFNMQEDDIATFMPQTWVATSSDGTNGHPRKYGSFPRKYHRYVKERRIISLQHFVRASSGLSADILGLENRGYLRNDYYADVLVFDPENYREKADFEHWDRPSTGVEQLLVNGVPLISDGELTGAKPGKGLTLKGAP